MRVELLLPAGDELSLRAAVANGADAVYFGAGQFNARRKAQNFENPRTVIEYCHRHNVKAYLAVNTLIKNSELPDFLGLIRHASDADALIIQDPCLIPLIRKHVDTSIHISTQATITATQGIPSGADRIILPRELTLDEVKGFTQVIETEVFVHGALCISYSGQCLFSSLVGGRSGNRGLCAQPCRKRYNNRYVLSTKDLCLLERLPDLIEAGVASLKVEGRLRNHKYVGTVARIYRKYIDQYYEGQFHVRHQDLEDLKLAFNRDFTEGFMFEDSITNPKSTTNKGLYLGKLKENRLRLRHELSVGDGIALWRDEREGFAIKDIRTEKGIVQHAKEGDIIVLEGEDYTPVYKTSTHKEVMLGAVPKKAVSCATPQSLRLPKTINRDKPSLFCSVGTEKHLGKAQDADILYVPPALYAKATSLGKPVFVQTPVIVSTSQAEQVRREINRLDPDGVLVSNRAFLDLPYPKHIDFHLNCSNDIAVGCYQEMGIPVMSLELTSEELRDLENKNFIVFAHGPVPLMFMKEPLRAPELIDDMGRHFKVDRGCLLNNKPLGLFEKIADLVRYGIKYFRVDDPAKIKLYRDILDNKPVTYKAKGYTRGHYERGVY
ncbi:MAG: U32 family peptidase [Nanobdellota archaeon]